jgi:pimeloyl-[acyl-carrier protein] methyl ester esterase
MSVAVTTIGNGPNLILLHGWGLNGAVWDSIVEPLAAFYTLHIVDLPGHGQSSHIAAATADEMVNTLDSLFASIDSTHVLGWSLGGQVALALAQRHPTKIQSLILVATTPKFVATVDWPHGIKANVLGDFAKRLSTNYAATIRNFLTLQALNQDQIRPTIALLQKSVLARGAPNIENLMHGLNILAETDLRAMVSHINQPALVFQGDHDALTPELAAQWLSDNMPNAHYHLIPHAAHAPFLSHLEEFLRAVKGFINPFR